MWRYFTPIRECIHHFRPTPRMHSLQLAMSANFSYYNCKLWDNKSMRDCKGEKEMLHKNCYGLGILPQLSAQNKLERNIQRDGTLRVHTFIYKPTPYGVSQSVSQSINTQSGVNCHLERCHFMTHNKTSRLLRNASSRGREKWCIGEKWCT